MRQRLAITCLGLLLLGFAHPAAMAQTWARKMFPVVEHDFGVVARGSEQHFTFQFKNLYKEDVVIRSVRSSCGCTTPSFQRMPVKSLETGTIVAHYNTRTMTGARGATLTISFEKPFPAEVQLSVAGFIRPDVFFQPARVEFGEVKSGQASERIMTVSHQGSPNWQIVDVRCVHDYFEVMLPSRQVDQGRVSYRMQVRLTESAPVGYLNDQLVLVTNDQEHKEIRLAVDGKVVSPLSVSPSTLLLGTVKVGDTVSRKIVIRGAEPFRVLAIRTESEEIQVSAPEVASKLHVVPVQFTASGPGGKRVQTVVIETDLSGGTTAKCVVTAEVEESP